MNRHRHLLVRTPEGVDFPIELGGPLVRSLAGIIDAAAVLVISLGVVLLLLFLRALSTDAFGGALFLALFAVSTGYGFLAEWLGRGQSLGKRVFRLRVADAYGGRLRFSQIVLRNLLRPVDALPFWYLLGSTCLLLSPRAQRLGDIVAGTVVQRLPAPTSSQAALPEAEPMHNSLREEPAAVARLRSLLGNAERQLLLDALWRRDALAPAARERLFRQLADWLTETAHLPARLSTELPPEQLVRHALVVSQPRRPLARPSTT